MNDNRNQVRISANHETGQHVRNMFKIKVHSSFHCTRKTN